MHDAPVAGIVVDGVMLRGAIWAVLLAAIFVFVISACDDDDPAAPAAAATYTVGGTVVGLPGTLVLQNNGGDDLTRTNSGTFTFATALANASAYAVTVLVPDPPATAQVCPVGWKPEFATPPFFRWSPA